MKTDLEKIEKNKVLLKVEVPAESTALAIKEAYKTVSEQVNIPGFRKGRVPSQVIDTKLGVGVVYNEALKQMLPLYYAQAVKETGIEPIDQPEIDVKQMEKDKPLIFEAAVEVKPEVKLGEYKGIEASRVPTKVTKGEIDERVEHLRNRFAKLEVVEEKRPLKKGDFGLIDFKGYIGETPFEQGSATDYLLELGSQTFVPGFEDQLIGAGKGEIVDVNVVFPKEYQLKEVAGKKVRFNVLVKEIKRKVLPELNDEFAKEAGEFDSLQALKSDLKAKLAESKKVRSDLDLRRSLLSTVAEEAEVEIPESMKRYRTEQLLSQFSQNLRSQGINMNDYLNSTKTDFETLKKSLEEEAVASVKSELVLEAIAKAEGIEVSDEEIEQEIRSYAQIMGKEYEEAKDLIEQKGTIWVIREDLTKRKTMDWLVEHAKIIEEKIEKVQNEDVLQKDKRTKKTRAKQGKQKTSKKEKKETENKEQNTLKEETTK